MQRKVFLMAAALAPLTSALAQDSASAQPTTSAQPDPNSNMSDSIKSGGYQFDPNSVVRDPFEAPMVQRKGETEEDEIVRFDVKEIKIVAIMKGIGSPKVMVKLPNNKYHILQVGDLLGKNRDPIFKIEEKGIVMEKTLKDFKGNKRSQLYTVEMESASTKGAK